MKIDELKALIENITMGLQNNPADLELLYKLLFVIQNNFEIIGSQDQEINEILADGIKRIVDNYSQVDFSQNKCYNNCIEKPKEIQQNSYLADTMKTSFSENLVKAWRRGQGVF